MGSIATKVRPDKRTGKPVEIFRAYIRRKGFISKSKVFRSKRDAQDWLRNNEADDKLERSQQGTTLNSLIEDFANSGACNWAKLSALDWWTKRLGEMRVADITHRDINGAVLALRGKPAMRTTPSGPVSLPRNVSAATINRYLATLSRVLAFAVDHGVIDTHPMKGGRVRKLKESGGRTRILTADEEQRLYAAARASEWPLMYLFLLTVMTTGARKSEVLDLKWDQIRLDQAIAILPKTKNGRPRALPLVTEVRELLAKASKVRPLKGGYVFFDPKRPACPKDIDSPWKKCRAAAGLLNDRDDRLDRVVLHTARHTAVTKLLRGGANLAQAAAVSGHQTLAMLKRYEHLAAQDAVDLAERLLSGGGRR